jgi:hypothetical protein
MTGGSAHRESWKNGKTKHYWYWYWYWYSVIVSFLYLRSIFRVITMYRGMRLARAKRNLLSQPTPPPPSESQLLYLRVHRDRFSTSVVVQKETLFSITILVGSTDAGNFDSIGAWSRFVFISDVGFHTRSTFVRPALVPLPVALFHSPVTFMTQFMSEVSLC